jgi:hypothetical protein
MGLGELTGFGVLAGFGATVAGVGAVPAGFGAVVKVVRGFGGAVGPTFGTAVGAIFAVPVGPVPRIFASPALLSVALYDFVVFHCGEQPDTPEDLRLFGLHALLVCGRNGFAVVAATADKRRTALEKCILKRV